MAHIAYMGDKGIGFLGEAQPVDGKSGRGILELRGEGKIKGRGTRAP